MPKQSLINRTGLILGAVMLLTIINMLVSFLTAESAENDAVRINLAGSLRMQSYRIAEALLIENNPQLNPDKSNLVSVRIDEFEQRLYNPVLGRHLQHASYPELLASYKNLETHWINLKELLNNDTASAAELLGAIDNFVMLIDQLVSMLESQTENKFRLLRLFQGISLLITTIIVVLGYVDVASNVVARLKRLLSVANKIRSGDFSQRLKVENDDELSLLAKTFNEMSTSLDAIYHDLESRVQEKTLHLEQARDGLALLYETSRLLSGEGSIISRIERSLVNINHYLPRAKTEVKLIQKDAEPLRLGAFGQPQQQDIQGTKRFNIGRDDLLYGELIVYSQQQPLSEQNNLLQAVADNIAAALNADWQQDQQHRLVLMEERTIIARELHDSLAQSLSYLKIQISRLQILKAKGDNPVELENTLQLIKSGIDAAYGQLRELLTTFRLQLSNEGLQSALKKTAEEFSNHSGIAIKLDYHLDSFTLTPNEEIHVLQIVREAISNVIRHSGATNASISVTADTQHNVEVCINDNGSGFTAPERNTNHYGKTIMQERTKTLGGHISFINGAEAGALVCLSFTAGVAKDQPNVKEEEVG